MHTVYPSKRNMVNGTGWGSGGGGFGQDSSQSTQAQGNVLFWNHK